jgi:hypothetical protein
MTQVSPPLQRFPGPARHRPQVERALGFSKSLARMTDSFPHFCSLHFLALSNRLAHFQRKLFRQVRREQRRPLLSRQLCPTH